jgi:hypothetical protein
VEDCEFCENSEGRKSAASAKTETNRRMEDIAGHLLDCPGEKTKCLPSSGGSKNSEKYTPKAAWEQSNATSREAPTVAAISDAVRWAEEIMREIDARWPAK